VSIAHERFAKLSQDRRVAVAAACVERVTPLYDLARGDRLIVAALDLAWSTLTRDGSPSRRFDAQLAALESSARALEEERGPVDPPVLVCRAAKYLLESAMPLPRHVLGPEVDGELCELADFACSLALDAVRVYAGRIVEEEQWQTSAVQLVESWVGSLSREAFSARIGAARPWL
jgi:hypothetical protein